MVVVGVEKWCLAVRWGMLAVLMVSFSLVGSLFLHFRTLVVCSFVFLGYAFAEVLEFFHILICFWCYLGLRGLAAVLLEWIDGHELGLLDLAQAWVLLVLVALNVGDWGSSSLLDLLYQRDADCGLLMWRS